MADIIQYPFVVLYENPDGTMVTAFKAYNNTFPWAVYPNGFKIPMSAFGGFWGN